MTKFLTSLQTVAVLLSIEYVSGHGYTTDPPTRAFACKKEGYKNSKGCKSHVGAALWEPHSNGNGHVNGRPKSVVQTNICGAGKPRFSGLSHYPAADWKATPIQPVNGKFHFKYYCTACHNTLSWEAWVTKPGWTGVESELRWSDMKRFCRIDKNGEKPPTKSEYDCPFPEATGNPRDIILVLWDRTRQDSGEMFFSCSDVIIGGGGGAPAPAPAPVPTTLAPAPAPADKPRPSPTAPAPKKNVSTDLDKVVAFIKTLQK